MSKHVYSGREKVRAALTIYDCPPSLIDLLMTKKTDDEWNQFVKEMIELAKEKEHNNIASAIIVNVLISSIK